MRFYDRHYGEIILNEEEAGLFNFPEFNRLKYLSQNNSAFFANISNTPTRLEHSLGVYFLASILAEKEDFKEFRRELRFAALLHDFGHPPFSHISENILIEKKGKDHEEYALELMEQSGIDKYFESIGIDYKFIGNLITGKEKPLGVLFNGSMDLDNLDNIVRWNGAVGVPGTGYDPIQIANGFRLINGVVSLDGDVLPEVENWLHARTALYRFIDEGELIIVGNMLRKALNYVYIDGIIDDSYFLLSDFEAKEFIKRNNRKSALIIERLERFDSYKRVYDKTVDFKVSLTWQARLELEKNISQALGFAEDEVIVFAGQLKGPRKIDLPFTGGKEIKLQNEKADEWRVIVAVQKDLETGVEKLEEILMKNIPNYAKI